MADLWVEGLNVSAVERRISKTEATWVGPEGQLIMDEAKQMIAILKHYFGSPASE
jgi:hypothetical protein